MFWFHKQLSIAPKEVVVSEVFAGKKGDAGMRLQLMGKKARVLGPSLEVIPFEQPFGPEIALSQDDGKIKVSPSKKRARYGVQLGPRINHRLRTSTHESLVFRAWVLRKQRNGALASSRRALSLGEGSGGAVSEEVSGDAIIEEVKFGAPDSDSGATPSA